MNVLVVGGAGYIGSHMVKLLLNQGHGVTALDSFATGFRDALVGGKLIVGDLQDIGLLHQFLSSQKFGGVIHFASSIVVGESVENPLKYYRNNVAGTLNLIEACVATGTQNIVFSSSAAVYGNPVTDTLDEDHPLAPINPYGRTKLICERMLEDAHAAHGVRFAAMRYFNAAGADPDGELGERHDPETHLIPLVLQAANKRRAAFTINGNDFPTQDGTCIRDYVHVTDLCEAHVLALKYLRSGGKSSAFNLGSGTGYSILDVIEAVRRVTGREFPIHWGPRRDGDPPRLVASRKRAESMLCWSPKYSDLETIVAHAWEWEQKLAAR